MTYDDVVRHGIRYLAQHGNLSPTGLAEAMAISRATLYRVIADQDRLLGDVLWSLAAASMDRAEREATGVGVERVMDVARRFHGLVQGFGPLRSLTQQEPERAFRVLFTPAGAVHERAVPRWAALFRREEQAGSMVLPFDADQFAEMFVRLGETMLWSDLLGARSVDVDLWDRVRRTMFTLTLDADSAPPGGAP